jgi:hypothetical protein
MLGWYSNPVVSPCKLGKRSAKALKISCPSTNGAKNVAPAKEFLKYAAQPKVLNEWLKGGLGRFMVPVPEIAKNDPFWLKEDPHRKAYTELTLLGQLMPIYSAVGNIGDSWCSEE